MNIDHTRLTGMEQFDEMTALREMLHEAPKNATVVVSQEGVVTASWDPTRPLPRITPARFDELYRQFPGAAPADGAQEAWTELQEAALSEPIELGAGTVRLLDADGRPYRQFAATDIKLSMHAPKEPKPDASFSVPLAMAMDLGPNTLGNLHMALYGRPRTEGNPNHADPSNPWAAGLLAAKDSLGEPDEPTVGVEAEGASMTILPNGRIVREYVSKANLMKYLGPKEASKQLAMLANPTGNRAQRRAAGKLIARKLKKGQAL